MKIPGYEGKRFFCVGNAKYPGRCQASGWSCGVNQLFMVKDNKIGKLIFLHQEWLADYCQKNDPPPQGDLFAAIDKEKQREETLRQLARIQEMLSRKK
jgi:hypothetical protein